MGHPCDLDKIYDFVERRKLELLKTSACWLNVQK